MAISKSKALTSPKMTPNNNNNNNGAAAKNSLLLNNKKSQLKLKPNSASPAHHHLSPQYKAKLDKASKISAALTTSSTATALANKNQYSVKKSSSESTNTTTASNKQAFNKLDYEPTTTTSSPPPPPSYTNANLTTSSTTTPPFSINNVSSNFSTRLSHQPTANNPPNSGNCKANAPAKAKNVPLKFPKQAFNCNNHNRILKTTCLTNDNSLNKLANVTATNHNHSSTSNTFSTTNQMKKVNFLIPEEEEEEEQEHQTSLSNVKKQDNSFSASDSSSSSSQSSSSSSLDDNNLDPKRKFQKLKKQKPSQPVQAPSIIKSLVRSAALSHDKLLNKNIVFNGTYPIDMPLPSNRFKNYDPEANCGLNDEMLYEAYISSNDDYDEEDDDAEEGEEAEEDEDFILYDEHNHDLESVNSHYLHHRRHKTLNSYGIIKAQTSSNSTTTTTTSITNSQKAPQVWSMQELINDPSIPLNYKKMCNEVEHSLQQFEKYIDSKNAGTSSTNLALVEGPDKDMKMLMGKQKTAKPVVKTFNIDDPIDFKKYK